ncbi:dynamin [Actinoplanes sp. OR16]|uniref:dynamin family protein n=1 Tax=Actinoplanes sp. OR16 TaxID=946334 RepID=UPI000F6DF3DE|nr:dynamin family protein [Actinoplanes sp. OR16]BBH69573.1 dynamin [Actinoplanes sp. OR16]
MTGIDGLREELADCRGRVYAEAARHGWQDAADLLDTATTADGGLRVVVAGETKRGKSRLINSIVGRPGLSPVGVDVTTACWVEFSGGDRDEADVLLADPAVPAQPVRRPIEVYEVEHYVSLDQVTAPVLGVQVRLPSPALDGLVLVDTPGVGGLHAGHSRITLAALGRADALLFVCDASQPILAPEIAFLCEAAQRITAITVAVTKSDLTGSDVVVEETRRRVAAQPGLAGVPVIDVSAALAENAADVENPALARRLVELSGMAALTAALRRQAAADSAALRLANAAQRTATVARLLLDRARRWLVEADASLASERELTDRMIGVRDLLADRDRLRAMVQQHLARLGEEPAEDFRDRAAVLGDRFRTEAERGPAAQLSTLAPRLAADLTAAGSAALQDAAEQTRQVMRQLIDAAGGGAYPGTLAGPAALELGLTLPELSRPQVSSALAHAAGIFPTLSGLVGGSAAVVAVLTGPGVIAACIAVAACAGWWKVWGENEEQRRAELGAWITAAQDEATTSFAREMRRRIREARGYAETALTELLTAEQAELTALRSQLAALRVAGDRARAEAARRYEDVDRTLRPLTARTDALLRQLSGPFEERSTGS